MLAYRHPDHLQRRLWGVAANLAVLAGWMSHDVGLEPTAQKYFVIAAHAAREGGDRPRAGEALSRAARQMVHLGRPDDALDLMKLAQSGSGEEALPRTRAMLHTIEAWAQASMGKGQAMRRTLGRGGGPLRLRQGRRAPADLDADLQGGGPARDAGAGLPHAGRARARRPRRRPAPRQEGAGAAGQRPPAVEDLRLHLHGVGLLHRATTPNRPTGYARLALVSMGENSSHRTWDRLREMYRLTAQYAGYPRIQRAARGDQAGAAEAEGCERGRTRPGRRASRPLRRHPSPGRPACYRVTPGDRARRRRRCVRPRRTPRTRHSDALLGAACSVTAARGPAATETVTGSSARPSVCSRIRSPAHRGSSACSYAVRGAAPSRTPSGGRRARPVPSRNSSGAG